MTTETIFGIMVALIGILPILILGIVQYCSKEPVGFWAGKEPPKKEQVSDVRAYNHRHGLMWILYGAGFFLCFCCGIFLEGAASAIPALVECIVGLLLMILYHNKLDRTYLKKGDGTK